MPPKLKDTKPKDTKPKDTKPKDTKPKDTKPESSKSKDTNAEGSKPQVAKAEGEKSKDTTAAEDLIIYIAYCKRRNNDPLHWMFMYARGTAAQKCTWVHSVDGPPNYVMKIQADKRLDSFGIETKQVIGKVKAKDENKLKSAAKVIPPQHCQQWVTKYVARVEEKGLLLPLEKDDLSALGLDKTALLTEPASEMLKKNIEPGYPQENTGESAAGTGGNKPKPSGSPKRR